MKRWKVLKVSFHLKATAILTWIFKKLEIKDEKMERWKVLKVSFHLIYLSTFHLKEEEALDV